MKQYDGYTRTDRNNRMVGHFCVEGDCFHCKAGVPFENPPADRVEWLTDEALASLRERNEIARTQAETVIRAIAAEQGARR